MPSIAESIPAEIIKLPHNNTALKTINTFSSKIAKNRKKKNIIKKNAKKISPQVISGSCPLKKTATSLPLKNPAPIIEPIITADNFKDLIKTFTLKLYYLY